MKILKALFLICVGGAAVSAGISSNWVAVFWIVIAVINFGTACQWEKRYRSLESQWRAVNAAKRESLTASKD